MTTHPGINPSDSRRRRNAETIEDTFPATDTLSVEERQRRDNPMNLEARRPRDPRVGSDHLAPATGPEDPSLIQNRQPEGLRGLESSAPQRIIEQQRSEQQQREAEWFAQQPDAQRTEEQRRDAEWFAQQREAQRTEQQLDADWTAQQRDAQRAEQEREAQRVAQQRTEQEREAQRIAQQRAEQEREAQRIAQQRDARSDKTVPMQQPNLQRDMQTRAPSSGEALPHTDVGTPFLPADASLDTRQRWERIQTEFVDDPRHSVADAHALVGELMQRIKESFTKERSELERQWSNGQNVSTEDLRVCLQRYRSFFSKLLPVSGD